MPRGLMLLGAVLGLVLAGLWAAGMLDGVAVWAAEGQRAAQNALARALRRLRSGEPGALAALIGLAFTYGVLHAAGPGHGKVLIGGYGVARRVRLLPLMAVALASSLAQATTAVVLVYTGVLVLDLTRAAMVDVTERFFAPVSYAAIGMIGLWLAWRGLRGLMRGGGTQGHTHGMGDGHIHDESCGCGHRHGPNLEEVAGLTGWRDAVVLIAGIAIRPCTGALFLLILCWRMGIDAVGIAGAYAMGLGTAVITIAVAGLSVWAREGAFVALSGGRFARALPLIELAAGLAVVLVAGQMLRATL